MESRFGQGFESVRIHDGPDANLLAGRLGARAFTYGDHVGFARNQFQPRTTTGRRLLAHEMTHVVQQRGPIPPFVQRDIFDDLFQAAIEKSIEAAQAAKRVAFRRIRSLVRDNLPASQQDIGASIVVAAEAAVDTAISAVLAVASVVLGFGEGAVDLIKGLLDLVHILVKVLLTPFEILVTGETTTDEELNRLLASLLGLLPALGAFFAGWVEEFKAASQEQQTAMIGRLTGQVLAIIASFGLAAGAIGRAGRLATRIAERAAVPPTPALATATATVPVAAPAGVTAAVPQAIAGGGPAAGLVGTTALAVSEKRPGESRIPKKERAQRPKPQSAAEIDARIERKAGAADPAVRLEAQVAQGVRGEVVGFDLKFGPNASIGQIDVLTNRAIVEVTLETRGKADQVRRLIRNRIMNPDARPVILYAPNYTHQAELGVQAVNGRVVRSLPELREVLGGL